METESDELTSFIVSTVSSITKGLQSGQVGYVLKSDIEFELAIVKTKKGEGKVSIFVADAGGMYQKEALSKIKFSIGKQGAGIGPRDIDVER